MNNKEVFHLEKPAGWKSAEKPAGWKSTEKPANWKSQDWKSSEKSSSGWEPMTTVPTAAWFEVTEEAVGSWDSSVKAAWTLTTPREPN